MSHPGGLFRATRSFLALAVLTLLLIAMPVGAQGLVEYEFAGTVTDTSGNLGIFGPFGTVQVNDVFTGRFSYMAGPGNADQEPGDPNLGVYQLVDFVLDQAVVPITPFAVAITHQPGLPTLPPLPADLGTDGFAVAGTFMAGQDPKVVTLRLEAPYEAVFNDDSLPTSLTLSDFTDSRVVRSIRVLGLDPGGTSQIDQGQLTSLVQVPEPSSAALLVLALVALGLVVKRSGNRRKSRFPGRADDSLETVGYPQWRAQWSSV